MNFELASRIIKDVTNSNAIRFDPRPFLKAKVRSDPISRSDS